MSLSLESKNQIWEACDVARDSSPLMPNRQQEALEHLALVFRESSISPLGWEEQRQLSFSSKILRSVILGSLSRRSIKWIDEITAAYKSSKMENLDLVWLSRGGNCAAAGEIIPFFFLSDLHSVWRGTLEIVKRPSEPCAPKANTTSSFPASHRLPSQNQENR